MLYSNYACLNFLTLSTFSFPFFNLSLIPLYSCTLELHLIFGFIYFLILFCFFVSLAHPLSIYLFLPTSLCLLDFIFLILNFIIMPFLVSYVSIFSLLDLVSFGIFMSSISLLHILKLWCSTSQVQSIPICLTLSGFCYFFPYFKF